MRRAPAPGPTLDKLTCFVPVPDAARVRAALAAAGAGAVGDYGEASFSVPGLGRFRPLDGANPTIGVVGDAETVEEERIEVVLPRARRTAVVRALLAAHPYEEPGYDVVELADPATSPTGTGRLGVVEPTTLRGFAERVAAALPPTAHGVRVGGDPDRAVRRVAVCGGAGDFLLEDVRRLDVDAYVTSDLRHHVAGEHLEHVADGGPALVDVAHWAAEWTWLPVLAEATRRGAGRYGGGPRERAVHRPLDPEGLRAAATRSAAPHICTGDRPESRPVRPAAAARGPGARRPRRPAGPPATYPARARAERHADGFPQGCRRRRPRRADRAGRPRRRAAAHRHRGRAGQGATRP